MHSCVGLTEGGNGWCREPGAPPGAGDGDAGDEGGGPLPPLHQGPCGGEEKAFGAGGGGRGGGVRKELMPGSVGLCCCVEMLGW